MEIEVSKEDLKKEIRFKDNISKVLRCPVSTFFPNKPIYMEDGYVYDEDAIDSINKRQSSKIKSPMTRQEMSSKKRPIELMKRLREEWIKINPEAKIDIYMPDMTYKNNKAKIQRLIEEKNWKKLVEYTGFRLEDMVIECCRHHRLLLIELILKQCSDIKIIEHIIKTAENENGWELIHYMCKYATDKILMAILEKEKDMNKLTLDGWTPLLLVASRTKKINVIKYIVDKGGELSKKGPSGVTVFQMICTNERISIQTVIEYFMEHDGFIENMNAPINFGKMPIHYICKTCESVEFYKKLGEMGVDLNAPSNNNVRPIHILSRYCNNIKVFNYFVERGIDMEQEDDNGWRPMHYVCKYGTGETIMYFMFTLEVLLNKPLKIYDGNERSYTAINMVELNRSIKEETCNDLINIMFQMIT